jgi:4-hydroxyacetophenone monooxygenase
MKIMATVFEEIATATREGASRDVADDAPAILSTVPPGLALPMADTPELLKALEETDAVLLVPVLYQLTGDEALLDRVEPHIKSVWEGGPNIPSEIQREIRDALHLRLTRPTPTNSPPITEGRLKRLMSVVVGEPVTDEFVPLLVEQMGFQPAGRFMPKEHRAPPAGYRVAIIGAGLSGLAAAVKLAENGYDYRIFEKEAEVGGVWWSNKYPGVGVDTPSHFYSYSFELNPDWPRYFSSGAVLMDYWKQVADKYALKQHIIFETKVASCIWDEDRKLWSVTTLGPDGVERREDFNAIISAAGLFSHPEMPKITGLEDYKGVAAHTAFWDPAIDVEGKRVVQIGTGASGLQVGPAIAARVEHLTVFQRTPPWVMVRPDRDYNAPTAEGFRWGLRHIPHLAQWMRFYTYWWASDGTHKVVVADPDWPDSDTSVSEPSERMRQMLLGGLQYKLKDRPDLLEKMTPNYPVMGKRLLQDSYWCDTLMRDNVDLVTTPIDRIVADGVLAADGTHYPADVLVLATGFALSKMMQQMDIVGTGGVRLRDIWGDEDPKSYLGTLVPGFPNLFLIAGPNGGATHGAGVNIYSEAQVNYILTCLDTIFEKGATTIEPTREAHDDYNRKIDVALEKTVWNHRNVTTYYRNSKGRNFLSCPWRIVDVWHLMRQPDTEDVIFA